MVRKGQAAIETLIVLGLVLAAILPVAFFFLNASRDNAEVVAEQQLERITRQISASADKVYYLGAPSKIALEFYFPDRIKSSHIYANEVYFQMRKQNSVSDVYAITKAPLNGSLPTTPGYHTITIESKGDYVWIS